MLPIVLAVVISSSSFGLARTMNAKAVYGKQVAKQQLKKVESSTADVAGRTVDTLAKQETKVRANFISKQ